MTAIAITGDARAQRQRLAAKEARKDAYAREADPLFFKWQAGEASQEEWQAKRDEIRARYPVPEELP